MVYKSRLIAVVKNNGKILREDGEYVTLPFGSEYSILLKNLESRRASVKIDIDGQSIVEGGLIIDANSEVEIERFIKDLDKGNRFRFIKKTEEISNHRGDRIDDGFIRIQFSFEKQKPVYKDVIINEHHYHHDIHWRTPRWTPDIWYNNFTVGSTTETFSVGNFTANANNSGSTKCSSNSNDRSITTNSCYLSHKVDNGITVPGSVSTQSFVYGNIGQLEDFSETIIIRLKGVDSKGINIHHPITTKTKLLCPTCGKKSKSYAHFCSKCSTSLK
jgi:hypothetical protein